MQSNDYPGAAAVTQAIAENKALPGALLPILHAIQDQLGFIPPAAIVPVAAALNLSHAEVHGVITFYHDFRTTPPGRHVLKLCRAEACQAMGSDALATRLRERLGVDFRQTTADGALTLEPVYCLGNCAVPPSLMLDGRVHGRVTPERLDRLLASLPPDVQQSLRHDLQQSPPRDIPHSLPPTGAGS